MDIYQKGESICRRPSPLLLTLALILLQIGKELLTPELPLSLRLIGLRVTKLKDLREDLDANAGGIKKVRFPETTGVERHSY